MILAHLAYRLAEWRFAAMAVIVLAMTAVPFAFAAITGRRCGLGMGCAIVTIVGLGLPAIFGLVGWGPALAARLVYRHGVDGEAIVTSRYDTDTTYNRNRVIGYRVLVRRPDGASFEAGFRTDSFNIYPPDRFSGYPMVGERFTARYLPDYPQDFVILNNDQSSFASSSRCAALVAAQVETQRKRAFVPDDPAYRAAFFKAERAVRTNGCLGPQASSAAPAEPAPDEPASLPSNPCPALLQRMTQQLIAAMRAPADGSARKAYHAATAQAKAAGCPGAEPVKLP